MVAETVLQGDRKEALNEGYRILSDYLTARSRPGKKLPMRVPVLQDAGNPMASDPPLFDDAVEGGWRVRFVMPEGELPEAPEGIELTEMAARVACNGLCHVALADVEEHAAPQHAGKPEHLGAVRIFGRVALCMVLAVHRRPLLRDHAGGKPQPEAKEMAGHRMQLQRTMGLVAVQEDGDRGNGDVRERQRHQHGTPPWKIENSGEQDGLHWHL
jgi:hypothetical protein